MWELRVVVMTLVIAVVAACGGMDEDSVEQAAVSAPPTLSSFRPGIGVQGTSVTLFGTNFTTDAEVRFGDLPSPLIVYLSSTRLIATVPTGATTGLITVTTLFGSVDSETTFKIWPMIGTINPIWALPGTPITVTGTGFTGTTGVKVRTTNVEFAVIDDATIAFAMPNVEGVVYVTNENGTDAGGEQLLLLPVVSSFAPTEGLVGSTVTIRGGGFVGTTAVKFHTTAAAYTVIDDTTIEAIVPNAQSPARITVISTRQRVTTPSYTIIKTPIITAFTPAESALPAQVTISGANFTGTTSVQLGGVEMTSFTVAPDTIVVEIPVGAPNGAFTVTNAAGSTTSASTFEGIDRCANVVCTATDACHEAGVCDPATGTCSNPVLPDGTACSDADACTQVDVCQAGTCVGASPVVCADVMCEGTQTCNPATGACEGELLPDGTACNDADACTQTDSCQTGNCVGANPVVCGDVPCEGPQACNTATGICEGAVLPDGTSCQADACTIAGTCSAGACNESMSCDTPVTAGLVGRWRAEDSAADDLGVHHGTWSGTSAYTVSSEGKSFQFASNSAVNVADHPAFDFGSGDFTISFRISTGGSLAITKGDGSSPNGWSVGYLGNELVFATRADGHITEARMPRPTTTGFANVSAVRRDGVVSLYLEGVLMDSTLEIVGADVSNDVPVRIGPNFAGSSGIMDDIRIYDRALAADELTAVAKCLPNYCVPNETCRDILDSGRSTGDGMYWINRPAAGYYYQERVFCDMTSDGGGWTLGFNIGVELGAINLASVESGWGADPFGALYGIGLRNMALDTARQFKLDCVDSFDSAYRKMFVTGINVNDVVFQAAGAFDPTGIECSQSADMANSLSGSQCLLADDNDQTYWGNEAWDMSWALYRPTGGGAQTLRHCHASGSGYWNRGRIWFR
jgi:hypothetical protein